MGSPLDELPRVGRFEIVGRLGAGGMGVVYEALDDETRTRVALKTIKEPSPEFILRLKREFRALQGLQHPNLVSLGELIELDGTWLFTMELVRGVDFVTHVRQAAGLGEEIAVSNTVDVRLGNTSSPWFDESRLRSALVQLAMGLCALHQSGKVHRDIKPSNVLVTENGRVVILDLGLVADFHAREESEESCVGTAAYMAPEQAARGRVGPEADWYSVGVVLYEALVGRLPFEGPALRILLNKQETEPAAPSAAAFVPADLDKLCVGLLRIDPAARPSGPDVLLALGANMPGARLTLSRTLAAPFVGRREELAFLRAAFDETRRGQPLILHVHGESGIGKTSLVKRFTDLAALEAEAVVLFGRCYERENVPFKAMDGVVDALGRYMGKLPQAKAAFLVPRRAGLLMQMFPVLGKVRVLAEAPRHEIAEPREHRAQVFSALLELLCRLADQCPTIVVIDDLQWADADSLDLLGDLLRPPDAPAVLLVTTWRETADSNDRLQDLESRLPGASKHLVLRPLPSGDARQLASALLELAWPVIEDAPRRAQVIAEDAAGHPLFIDELSRQLSVGGEAPARFEDSVLARIARLDARAQKILQLIMVAGEPILQVTVARAAGLEIGTVMRELSGLRVMNLVRTAGRGDSRMVEPYHDRIRRAVLGSFAPDVLKACHRDLARALEGGGDANPETLAMHYKGAGEDELAAKHVEEAANRASRSLAFDRAARLFRLALELGPKGASHARGLRIRLGNALASTGRGAEAAEEFLRAADGASAAEDLELRRLAAQQLLVTGHIDEGLATLRQVLAAEGISYPSTPLRALATVAWRRLRLVLGRKRLQVRDESVIPGKDLARIDACYHVGTSLGVVDHVRGHAFNALGLLFAMKAGEPHRVARALAVEAGFHSVRGGRAVRRTLELLEKAEALAEKTSEPYVLALVRAVRGQAAHLWGRFREAHDLCQEAEALFGRHCVGVPWEITTARLWSSRALQYLGDVGELARRVPQLVNDFQSRNDRYGETSLRVSVSPFLCLAHDNPRAAKEEIAEGLHKWSPKGFHVQHYFALYSRVSADLYAGEVDEACRTLNEGLPELRRALLLRVQFVRIVMNDLRGRVALASSLRNGADKQKLLREALKVAAQVEAEEAPWARPVAVLLRAGVAAAQGTTGGTLLALLEDALKGFEASEMGLHAACVRYWLGTIAGGHERHVLREQARLWMAAQAIKSPERMAALLAPAVVV
ncbi:MAG: AAA family ATPase [Deltaproteobacteria bacterium]|nr:AAA family ATPase [Deltaproteobacteria bacterium]